MQMIAVELPKVFPACVLTRAKWCKLTDNYLAEASEPVLAAPLKSDSDTPVPESPVVSLEVPSTSFDCGSRRGYLLGGLSWGKPT